MTLLAHELRLLARQRLTVAALALLAALVVAALAAGLTEVARQRAAIAAIPAAQAEDIGAVAAWVDGKKDAGSAAYYSFHPTWDAPAPLAFAALGVRDVSPYILRVRALGLEAQIWDGDTFNPELALPGRFDFAFVLVFLAPLFVVALFHDLRSGEREAGRERMLDALPDSAALWRRRAWLRLLLLWAGLALPFAIAASIEGVGAGTILLVVVLVAAYLLFWIGLAALVGRARRSSVTNAAIMAAAWLVLVLVLPTLANVAINAGLPVTQGAEIAMAQREAVNRAWDVPRGDTMRRFYARHPQWADSPPLGISFHYKWYLAFHQNGDESVAPRVAAYRAGLEARDAAGRSLGWVLPSVGMQGLLTRLARTDLAAHLAYQDRIRAFHRRLRFFYYDYLSTTAPSGRRTSRGRPASRTCPSAERPAVASKLGFTCIVPGGAMRMFIRIVAAVAVLAALPAAAAPRPGPDAELRTLLAGRVAGKPTSCISLLGTWSLQIVDRKAIVYRIGSTLWVNEPRSGADRLREDDIIVTRTQGTQLCRIDVVNLIDRGSGIGHGFLVLGDFVPYSKVKSTG